MAAHNAQPAVIPGGGLDETFLVHADAFRASLPFSIDVAAAAVTLDVQVRYQACGTAECYPPATLALTVPLAGEDLIRE